MHQVMFLFDIFMFCTQLMSVMDTVVQTLIVYSGMENKGKSQSNRYLGPTSRLCGSKASDGLYTPYLPCPNTWDYIYCHSLFATGKSTIMVCTPVFRKTGVFPSHLRYMC